MLSILSVACSHTKESLSIRGSGSPFALRRYGRQSWMIIAKRYTVMRCEGGEHFKIKNQNAPLCPVCSVLMSGYDTRLRHCIGVDGVPRWFKLRRLRCPSCRKLHLELPDFMERNKHYEAQLIAETIAGIERACPAEDSTIRRWKKSPPGLPPK